MKNTTLNNDAVKLSVR